MYLLKIGRQRQIPEAIAAVCLSKPMNLIGYLQKCSWGPLQGIGQFMGGYANEEEPPSLPATVSPTVYTLLGWEKSPVRSLLVKVSLGGGEDGASSF